MEYTTIYRLVRHTDSVLMLHAPVTQNPRAPCPAAFDLQPVPAKDICCDGAV